MGHVQSERTLKSKCELHWVSTKEHERLQGLFTLCVTKCTRNKLEGEVGDTAFLQAQTSPYF